MRLYGKRKASHTRAGANTSITAATIIVGSAATLPKFLGLDDGVVVDGGQERRRAFRSVRFQPRCKRTHVMAKSAERTRRTREGRNYLGGASSGRSSCRCRQRQGCDSHLAPAFHRNRLWSWHHARDAQQARGALWMRQVHPPSHGSHLEPLSASRGRRTRRRPRPMGGASPRCLPHRRPGLRQHGHSSAKRSHRCPGCPRRQRVRADDPPPPSRPGVVARVPRPRSHGAELRDEVHAKQRRQRHTGVRGRRARRGQRRRPLLRPRGKSCVEVGDHVSPGTIRHQRIRAPVCVSQTKIITFKQIIHGIIQLNMGRSYDDVYDEWQAAPLLGQHDLHMRDGLWNRRQSRALRQKHQLSRDSRTAE
ncbi:hypothetical protein H257_01450 [Aphanomyces astaci]|uniref:Uncharacterized protein n=1 Tax=Aphanomyces astaci TaxID=112090 RepID=W4H881_APHAT|nr:hypothetical protein H257_01450 [Aphanomyces astaci]ETV88092.1 hypothetical protein H257_01450 [Aphanomyces astaci]|eukprot:XP_009822955.1 hypothetical protein H257_01450 [Aphanomyces astaci]